jgi:hypothetical protein
LGLLDEAIERLPDDLQGEFKRKKEEVLVKKRI